MLERHSGIRDDQGLEAITPSRGSSTASRAISPSCRTLAPALPTIAMPRVPVGAATWKPNDVRADPCPVEAGG